MKGLLRYIYNDRTTLAKFIIIGGLGFICNYAVLGAATGVLHWDKILAEVAGAAVALQVTFLLHDRWTYRVTPATHQHRQYHLRLIQRYRLYIVTNSTASLLTVAFFALFSLFLGHFFALALSAVAGLVWNFCMNKMVVWRHKEQAQSVDD